MSTYVLRGGSEAAKRLNVLAEASWPTTERMFQRIGVQRGWKCLDAGCGNGHVAIKLAGLVGATGKSVGEDFDAKILEVAREDAAELGAQVEFRQRSVFELREGEGYDLVYARFLLTHLADPREGLRSLIRAAKPGGFVVVEDIDFHTYFSWPQSRAFDRYVELYRETSLRMGADPLIGPKLVGMFLDAELDDVQFEPVEPLFREGVGKLIPQLTMEHIRENVVSSGLASHEEITQIVSELDALRQDPQSLMGYPRVFQVWGRRPQA
jgi:ubiquinone/menaquinone biosynthesis C-methylase UbiE